MTAAAKQKEPMTVREFRQNCERCHANKACVHIDVYHYCVFCADWYMRKVQAEAEPARPLRRIK